MESPAVSFLNERDEQIRLLKGLAASFTKLWLILCFTSWWVWMLLGFQSLMMFPMGSYGRLTAPSYCCALVAMVLTFAVVSISFWHRRFTVGGKVYLRIIMLMMFAGALTADAWILRGCLLGGVADLALYSLASILLGISCALFYIEFNRIGGHLGMLKTIYFNIVSLVVGAIVALVLELAPMGLRLVTFAALPVVFYISYRKSTANLSRQRYVEYGMDTPLYLPMKFMLTSFIQGVACGICAVMQGRVFADVMEPSIDVVVYVGTLLLLLAITVLVKIDFNMLIYQVGFLIMALGFVLSALAASVPCVGVAVQSIGFFFTFVMLGALGSHLIKDRRLPAIWIAACPGGCLFLGVLIGFAMGSLCASSRTAAHDISLSLIMTACVLLVLALLLSSSDNIKTGWGTISQLKALTTGILLATFACI